MTATMRRVLRVLEAATVPMTASEIAHGCKFQRGQDRNRHARDGRRMSVAQRVIFPLIGLRKLGLVRYGSRPDGLSGTAYVITGDGRKEFSNAST